MRTVRIILICLALFLPAIVALANIPMSLKTNQRTYMRGETVYLQIGIQNDTGRALVFGDIPELKGEVTFQLYDSQGNLIPEISGAKIELKDAILKPGEARNFVAALNTNNALLAKGVYRIYARVSHSLVPLAYRSDDRRFEISDGSIIKEFQVGIPDVTGDKKNEKVQSRVFSLRYMIDGPMRYFYIVLSDDKKIYQVLRLGQEAGLERPSLAVDMVNSLHVLSAVSGKVYKYVVLDINGRILTQNYFRSGESSPSLVRGANGKVHVAGGSLAQAGVDYDIEKSNVFPDSNVDDAAD